MTRRRKTCMQCRKPLSPYKPPAGVPNAVTRDPFCSRACCEQWHGVNQRQGKVAA
jgi:hypothetical protein